VFVDIFSVDRPGRALVMIPAYILFGANPLYYNLSAYVFRVVGALALFWSLNMLWPGRRTMTILMALLFVIYPGFLSAPNAIDYQSHVIGLAAALSSIALTLKATLTQDRVKNTTLHILSILLGWLYLSQMEWYIGFELFRWASVWLLSSRLEGDLLQKGKMLARWAYPSLAIPLFFLIWRLFLFESERGATDTEVQFELFRLYPLQTLFHWTVQVLQDLFDVLLAAWVIPLAQLMDYIQWWGSVLGVLVLGLVFFVFDKWEYGSNDASEVSVTREAVLLGLFTAIVGLIPIAMVNREVTFPVFSRYSLVSSVGVSIFTGALVMSVRKRGLRNALVAGLILVAMLTHHANSVRHAEVAAAVRTFWWQVSWRAPQLQPRTTLIGYYPVGATEEDYFIWGPANLIYYPEQQNSEAIQPALFASVLNKVTVTKVLARERQKYDNRKNIVTYPNHRNILVLTQPALSSCVHIINGLQPEFSAKDLESIRTIGSYSEIEHVLVGQAPHTPPTVVFGPEPSHDWCYYYEKADLARQRGDWDEVLKLGSEAFEKRLVPGDNIEWMPFLQAYAQDANIDRLTELASFVTSDPDMAQQVCQILGSMPGLTQETGKTIESLFCLN
ncbi:MAG TPA: hypothetical protein VMN99_07935, partial [Anaerolineales bacterium]|nr:hypothetical protein [Anaerolineales bacterium]